MGGPPSLRNSLEVLSRHYGVRVTVTTRGPPIVDVSMPAAVGHAENVTERPGTVGCRMVRFRGDRVLFSVAQDDADKLVTVLEWSARVIQAAYRRHAGRGDPFLPCPPRARASKGDPLRPLTPNLTASMDYIVTARDAPFN